MSSIALGPRFTIDGPLPVAPRYGLLAVAMIQPPSIDEHWMVGATVRAYSSDLPEVWAPCYEGSTADVKAEGGETAQPSFGPYTVYLPVTCTVPAALPDDEFRTRALAAFVAKEGWAVERELALSVGQFGTSPYLADANADVLNAGAAVSAAEALAMLEDAVGDTAQAGIVHADPGTATAWASEGLIAADGPILRTALGTPVAVGGGYRNATPDGEAGAAAHQAWAFASGPVHVRRSNTEIPGTFADAFEPTTNRLTERVERHYLVAWDTTLQAAILVDRTLGACCDIDGGAP